MAEPSLPPKDPAWEARERWYQALLELSNDLVLVLDGEGRVRYESPSFERLLGIDRSTRLGAFFLERVHPEDISRIQDSFQSCLNNPAELVRAEARIAHPDGRWRHVSCVARNLLADPAVAGVVVNLHEISERKWAQSALRVVLRAVEQSPSAIVITDRAGRIEYANPAFSEGSGFSLEEALGENPRVLKSGLMPAETYAELWSTISRGQVWRGELLNRSKDGRTYWEFASIAPVLDEEGRITHFVAVKEDISDRKAAEAELARLNQRTAAILDSSAQGIFGTDPSGAITFINATGARLLGCGSEELLGLHHHAAFHHHHPDGRVFPLEECPFHAVSFGGEGRLNQRTVFWRKDGSSFLADVSALPLEEEGQRIGAVVTFSDITDQEAADSALRQAAFELELKNSELSDARDAALEAFRLKSEFLANLSHEIRTPMNAVMGMAGLLARSELNDEQRSCLETIVQSGDLLLRLLNDMLDFSKLEAHRLELDPIDFCPRTAMEEATALFTGQAAKKGLSLVCDLDPELPPTLNTDALRLRQVATNLLSNGLKFTERGSVTLRLRWLADSQRLRLEVIDTGIGIPSASLQRIFQPFTQADGSTTRRYGGTGLGLSICRELLDLLGGSLGVESLPGQGSCFWAEVPVQPVLAAQPDPPRPALVGVPVRVGLPPGPAREGLVNLLLSLGLLPDAPGPWSLQILTPDQAPRPAEGRPVLYLKPGQEASGTQASLREPLRSAAVAEVLESTLAGGHQQPLRPSSLGPRLLPVASREAPAILVVDDHEMNLQLLEALLRDLGCYTRLAWGGQEALERLAERSYSLVLLDCQMPGMDGFETVAELRRREDPGKRTPVVAVTANALDGDRERALAAGMDDYLVKPFTPEALDAMVARWTGWTRPQRALPELISPQPGLLDESALTPLRQLKGPGGGPLVAELASLFLRDLPGRLEALTRAFSEGDALAFGRAAHALKGPSGSLGARDFSARCLELEKRGRSGDLTGCEAEFMQVLEEAERVAQALRGEVQASAS